jgi:eukaryotic-like serine/threonine-protein kinase
MIGRTVGRLLLTVMLAGGVGAIAVAGPAQAAIDCSVSHSANGEGSGYTEVSRPLKVGPYGDCAKTGANTGTYGKVWLHCYVYNSYSNLWWWVRIDGTSKEGWIYADYLTGVDFDDNDDGRENIKTC